MADAKDSFKLYCDGGSRGNPGPSGAGFVLIDADGKTLAERSKYVGIATNNIAEYLALIYGLQEALYLRAGAITIFLDSELIVKQLKGEYRVKDKTLQFFFDLARQLIAYFEKVTVQHIKRAENKQADKLVNEAINLGATAPAGRPPAGKSKDSESQIEFF